jgi:hypothetical protein
MGFMDIFSVKSIDNAVDAIINTGDAVVYTAEEKAQAEQLKIDTKLKMLPLFEPFKLAQRYIAFGFTASFILSFWVGVILFAFFPTYLDGFLKLVSTFEMGWIMLAIISFYFGGGMIGSFKGLKK